MNSDKRSQLTSGFVLIAIGLLFLLNTFGYSFRINWRYLAHFWPLLLIFIGLNILLKKTPLWWLVPLLIILTIIGLFVTGPGWSGPFNNRYFNFPFFHDSFRSYNRDNRVNQSYLRSSLELVDQLQQLDVVVKMGAGQLSLGQIRDNGNLYQADLHSGSGKPRLDYNYEQETGIGRLIIEEQGDVGRLNLSDQANQWQLNLTDLVPVMLKIEAGAGEFNFDLKKLIIEEITVNLGAGALAIDLGEDTRYLELNSATADIELNIPEQIAVEITTNGVISNNNFLAAGLSEINQQTFRSRNFELLEGKTRIKINAAASNIEVNLY